MSHALPRRSLLWHFGLSAYWFSTSLKWFVLLSVILPGQVEQLVPGGEKGKFWGRVVMLGAIWAMIGPSLFGFLSDRVRTRFGRWKPFVAIGAALTVVALMILANPKQYFVIVIGYLFLQVADDIGQGPYSSLIPALVSEEERGRASGILGLLRLSAQVTGGIIALVLRDVFKIYVAIAIVTILCALITLLSVREEPGFEKPKSNSFYKAWIQPWKDADFRWMWFTRFLNALGFYLISIYLLYFLIDRVRDYKILGWTIADPAHLGSKEEAAKITMFMLALSISFMGGIGALIGGKLTDTIGRKRVIMISGLIMAATIPPFIFYPHFGLLVSLAVVFGVAYGMNQSAEWALASDVMPNREELAKDMGLWQSSIATPQVLTGVSGMLLDWGNRLADGFGYQLIFLLSACAFLLGTVLVRKIRRSR
ncbi:MAG TPA: MFS transporter [Fimbriimonadales bacterium]|nr:MFS transporter [Fimbriimonadales bacterium]